MQFTAVLCFLGFVLGVSSNVHFRLTDCSSQNSNRLLSVSNVTLSKDPVIIGGTETIIADVHVFHPVAGSNLKLEIIMHRHMFFTWVKIPCVHGMGSCTYDDMCQYLSSGKMMLLNGMACPLARVPPSSSPVNCTCPLQTGSYHMDAHNVHIMALTGLLAAFASGDYRIDVHITDNNTHQQVGCFHIDVTAKTV